MLLEKKYSASLVFVTKSTLTVDDSRKLQLFKSTPVQISRSRPNVACGQLVSRKGRHDVGNHAFDPKPTKGSKVAPLQIQENEM